jgi:hypothetical protein
MGRLNRDRAFRSLSNRHFRPLPEHLQERLACESFIDDTPVVEEDNDGGVEGFFERLFGGRDNNEQQAEVEQERAEGEQEGGEEEGESKEEERERKAEERRAEKERKREERRRRREGNE